MENKKYTYDLEDAFADLNALWDEPKEAKKNINESCNKRADRLHELFNKVGDVNVNVDAHEFGGTGNDVDVLSPGKMLGGANESCEGAECKEDCEIKECGDAPVAECAGKGCELKEAKDDEAEEEAEDEEVEKEEDSEENSEEEKEDEDQAVQGLTVKELMDKLKDLDEDKVILVNPIDLEGGDQLNLDFVDLEDNDNAIMMTLIPAVDTAEEAIEGEEEAEEEVPADEEIPEAEAEIEEISEPEEEVEESCKKAC